MSLPTLKFRREENVWPYNHLLFATHDTAFLFHSKLVRNCPDTDKPKGVLVVLGPCVVDEEEQGVYRRFKLIVPPLLYTTQCTVPRVS